MSKLKIVPTAAAFAASRSLFPGLAQWAKNGENVAIISATCSMSCCMIFLFEMFSSLQSPNVFAYHLKKIFFKKWCYSLWVLLCSLNVGLVHVKWAIKLGKSFSFINCSVHNWRHPKIISWNIYHYISKDFWPAAAILL